MGGGGENQRERREGLIDVVRTAPYAQPRNFARPSGIFSALERK